MSKRTNPGLPEQRCGKCGKTITLVHNLDSGKAGPIDLNAIVYVVRKGAEKEGLPLAMTGGKFMERLVHVVLDEGGEQVTYGREDFLGLFISHFQTCPHADDFSRKGRK